MIFSMESFTYSASLPSAMALFTPSSASFLRSKVEPSSAEDRVKIMNRPVMRVHSFPDGGAFSHPGEAEVKCDDGWMERDNGTGENVSMSFQQCHGPIAMNIHTYTKIHTHVLLKTK